MIALPRRGLLGFSLAERDGEVVVERVAPDTPAHAASLRPGDIVVGIDGEPARSTSIVRARMAQVIEGEEVLLLLRTIDGAEREVMLAAAPKPLERHDGCDVVYDAIVHEGARLRRIITLPAPAEEAAPWMLYVQGHSASSVDGGAHPERPLPSLAAAFARRGIAFVRVERSGTGDSEGPPPHELSMRDEHRLYATALHATSAHARLAPDRGVLFAHSLGGVVGGALAADDATRPRGLVVYGGGAKTWTEYFDENCRRQWTMTGTSLVQQDASLRALQRFHALAITARLSLDEVRARMPEVAENPAFYGLDARGAMRGRPLSYWREVQDAPIPAHLAAAAVPVLAAWGASDWLSSREDHALVAACVNEGTPGLGDFTEVAGADHYFAERESAEVSFRAKDAGVLTTSIVDACVAWLERRGLLGDGD